MAGLYRRVYDDGAIVEEVAVTDPLSLFAPVAAEPFALLLDSATAAPGRDPALHGRWTFLAADPFSTLTCKNGRTQIDETPDDGNPFDLLADRLGRYAYPSIEIDGMALPWCGGAAGYFAYDLAHVLERLPPQQSPFACDDQDLPDLALGFYDTVLACDGVTGRAFLISTGAPEGSPARRAARAEQRINKWRARAALSPRLPEPQWSTAPYLEPQSNFSRPDYERTIARTIDYIFEGDIFQANIAQRFEMPRRADDTPFEIYRRLREISPAPYAAYFNFGTGALLSSSPEKFLTCRNGEIETRPIKGTRPRGATPEADARLMAELAASEKDRAENVMIVDLLRNDLSRVCRDHSVQVDKLCAIESFATVHHLVSTITGRLQPGLTALDALTACFPGGSITGAPKIRAMEIIAELEPTTRGPYCGSIGYLGFDGAMDTNIAIRTAICTDRRITYQAGGGIVADSDPAAEYEETLTKASALTDAIVGRRPHRIASMPRSKDRRA